MKPQTLLFMALATTLFGIGILSVNLWTFSSMNASNNWTSTIYANLWGEYIYEVIAFCIIITFGAITSGLLLQAILWKPLYHKR